MGRASLSCIFFYFVFLSRSFHLDLADQPQTYPMTFLPDPNNNYYRMLDALLAEQV